MRIAFDLDGVLADLHTPFVTTAIQLFPELDAAAIRTADVGASPPSDPDREPAVPGVPAVSTLTTRQVDRRQADAIWKQLVSRENFWEGLDEIEPGAIARLAALAEKLRWEIMFITSRPGSAGRTVQKQSQRWLSRLGFPMPSVFTVHGSRGRVASAFDLDVVVDDRPDNCLDIVLESKAGAVLIWRGPQDTVPMSARRLGIAVAPTVAQCLDTLVDAEKAHDGETLLDRLRNLFGLRTKSSSVLRRASRGGPDVV
jgi:hypothetical protein